MKRTAALHLAYKTALGFVTAAMWLSAYAQSIRGYPDSLEAYDSREIAMLPNYCIYTQTFRGRVSGSDNPQMYQRWSAQMGPTFTHMHHYCWGLMKTNRAILLAKDQATRHTYLRSSLEEFDYVIQRSPADFVLLPEILTRKAQNLILLGKGAMAIVDLERAIELKSDYWPPYAHLSDYYKSIGDLKTARVWLEKGLVNSPDAKGLTRRLSEIHAPDPSAKKDKR